MADKYLLQLTGTQVDSRLESPKPVSQGGTGQSSRYNTVTVTNDTSVASDHAITVRYYPYLGMCFVRGYVKISGQDVAANTAVTVCTVPEGYRPGSITALALSILGTGNARVMSNGNIAVSPQNALSASSNYVVYFSGWWIVA